MSTTDPSSDPDPWLAREPGFAQARLELRRLARRAVRRPLVVIVLAAVLAAGVAWQRARRPPLCEAQVVFRMIEARPQGSDNAPPPPARELREYVWSVALAASRLLEIMDRHDLEPALRAQDPVTAVALFREDIGLEVWRNYFLVDEGPDSERSARMALTYRGPTLATTEAIARDLADLIGAEEDRRRTQELETALAGTRMGVDLARADLERREAQIAAFEAKRRGTTPEHAALLDVELVGLRKSLGPANQRLLAAQKDFTALELQLGYEGLGQGLRFERVDESVHVVTQTPHLGRLLWLGGALFFLLLPFVGLVVGALDPRVYDADDVRRLGVPILGHVPPFRGEDVGSLRARARASGRV